MLNLSSTVSSKDASDSCSQVNKTKYTIYLMMGLPVGLLLTVHLCRRIEYQRLDNIILKAKIRSDRQLVQACRHREFKLFKE
jgi:hypothetical protein